MINKHARRKANTKTEPPSRIVSHRVVAGKSHHACVDRMPTLFRACPAFACHLGRTASVSSLSFPAVARLHAPVTCKSTQWGCRSGSCTLPLACLASRPADPAHRRQAGGELAYLAYSPQGSNRTQTTRQRSPQQSDALRRPAVRHDKRLRQHLTTGVSTPIRPFTRGLVWKAFPRGHQSARINQAREHATSLSFPPTSLRPVHIHHYSLPFR